MSNEAPPTSNNELPKELVQRAELAMNAAHYLYNAKNLLDNEAFNAILEAELKAMAQLCEACGGAMCDEYCPVFRYTFDISKFVSEPKCENGES